MLNWIRPGSKSIKKDSVKTHCNSAQHKEALRLKNRSDMGAGAYADHVIQSTPIGRAMRRMAVKDRDSICKKFNVVYYLAKSERPFSDYPDLLELNKKNGVNNLGRSYATSRSAAVFTDYIGKVQKDSFKKDIKKARFYTALSDGSSDSANIEQEAVYILYLLNGKPVVQFLSVESAENADAQGLR